MGKTILTKVRKLNWLLQEAPKGIFSFDDLCQIIGELTDTNMYLADVTGKIIGLHLMIEEDSNLVADETTGIQFFQDEHNAEILKIEETVPNFSGDEVLQYFNSDDVATNKIHMLIPVMGGGERCGTLLMTRYAPLFSDEEIALAEIGATTVGIEIKRVEAMEREAALRREEIVRMAIGTLSYSENEAVKRIFEELEGLEGILVASRIADKSSITRSVIVNALRKLESAGVIESKSLGMKGTHIKVLNDKLIELLEI